MILASHSQLGAASTGPGLPTQEDLSQFRDTATTLRTPSGYVSKTSMAFMTRGSRAKEYFRRVLVERKFMISNKRNVQEDGWFDVDYQSSARLLPYWYARGVQEMNAMGWLGKLWYRSTAAAAKQVAQLAPIRAAQGWGQETASPRM